MAKNKVRITPEGRVVMVHPLLTKDPANMQGEIGKVIVILIKYIEGTIISKALDL